MSEPEAAELERLRAEVAVLRGMCRVGKRRCPTCDGGGYYPEPGNPEGNCRACNGTGYYLVTPGEPPGETVMAERDAALAEIERLKNFLFLIEADGEKLEGSARICSNSLKVKTVQMLEAKDRERDALRTLAGELARLLPLALAPGGATDRVRAECAAALAAYRAATEGTS